MAESQSRSPTAPPQLECSYLVNWSAREVHHSATINPFSLQIVAPCVILMAPHSHHVNTTSKQSIDSFADLGSRHTTQNRESTPKIFDRCSHVQYPNNNTRQLIASVSVSAFSWNPSNYFLQEHTTTTKCTFGKEKFPC